uniref:Zinc finger protein, FOG family member 1 n=1 Tax=Varanus komodoensis TaxID=61221 RepID=A0A8D2LEA8_VARKO
VRPLSFPRQPNPPVTLVLEDEQGWLSKLPLVCAEGEANSVIYKKGQYDSIFCKTTKPIPEGEPLSAFVMAEPMGIPNHAVKTEAGGAAYPAVLPPEIQLLPQQAGMAAILATAVVNKDVFPCKDCGIWYRSERNLQAHLMYYCASRQSAASPTVDDKPKDVYPNERVCPFPQCKKSCPSASSLEIHMRSHSGERGPLTPGPAPGLKCSFCGHVADGLPALQQHVLLHSAAAALLPGTEPKAAHGPPDAPPRPTAQGGRGLPTEEAANGSPPPEGRPPPPSADGAPPVRIKEEPVDEGEAARGAPTAGPEPEPEASSGSSSPHSLPSVKVKSEIASPTPGSSPVPSETGSGAPGGTVFLPQYVFGHEAAVVPQASEILAKMSELVHSRLKQGQGGLPPALFPGPPVPKGATCFECEITFNNINNYYVHKRMYCSSRRLAEESPPGPRRPKATPSAAPKGPAAPGLLPAAPGEGKEGPDPEAGGAPSPPAPEAKPEAKPEEGAAKASPPPPVADGAGRGSEDSRSPGGSSAEDPDDDPSRTVCEACSIRFSRHETFTVHKRYYCASRHDPPLRRGGPGAGRAPFLPQPVRTRKRRKLYEIHGAPEAARAEGPPGAPALLPVGKAAPSPGSSPDADGPIDLSKKPRPPGAGGALPASLLPLADYHECTACRISFHGLDSYLVHKKYYCPTAPLQAGALEQLRKLKGAVPVPVPLKPRGSPEGPAEEPGPVPGLLHAEKAAPATAPSGALGVCPYCPLNGAIKGDLADHLRNAHGLFVAKAGAGPAPIEPPRTLAESPLLPPLPAASPPRPLPRLRKDSSGGKDLPAPPVSNGSPHPTASPQPLLPVSPPAPLPPSPRPEAAPGAPPGHTDKSAQTPPGKGPPAPLANGSHRYCRLCNIQFSSLSTFIAHKKYYCSSHAAEHVK